MLRRGSMNYQPHKSSEQCLLQPETFREVNKDMVLLEKCNLIEKYQHDNEGNTSNIIIITKLTISN